MITDRSCSAATAVHGALDDLLQEQHLWTLAPKPGAEVVVGQVVKIDGAGGRINVRCAQDGKVLWRSRADLTPPFDDAPKLPILGGEPAGAKEAGGSSSKLMLRWLAAAALRPAMTPQPWLCSSASARLEQRASCTAISCCCCHGSVMRGLRAAINL